MSSTTSRPARLLAAAATLSVATLALSGCVVDHRRPGWYHWNHRWHHRPPPPGIVVD